ncbi:hypothetical protein Tsubulata_021589 [Turnera subulata]|uniref:RRM domain-containing protein n=1 Tax=Turnera subulata TaxID=218843 RepID=A0A9Q0GF82_9ROSI|nr:hypothetical protein Tsubulata_021589 [Turnera subulata]
MPMLFLPEMLPFHPSTPLIPVIPHITWTASSPISSPPSPPSWPLNLNTSPHPPIPSDFHLSSLPQSVSAPPTAPLRCTQHLGYTPLPSSLAINLPVQNPYKPSPKPQQFSKWSRKQIQNITENQHVTNLYIQNEPLQWTVVELHFILSKCGEVNDVFIPSKRAKNGKRFGFVRFRACRDIQRLISSINLIKVGNSSLQALIARGHDYTNQNHVNTNHTPKTLPPPPTYFVKTFADIAKKAIPACPKVFCDKANISFSTLKSETEWLSSCAFGVLTEPLEMHVVLQSFLKHGISVTVSDFGGVSILIKFPTSKDLSTLFESDHAWPAEIFDLLRPWKEKVFKPISWEISAQIDDISFHIDIDEIQHPPSVAILPSTSLVPAQKPSKSPSISPVFSKPSSSSHTSKHLPLPSGGASAVPSDQHNSDPFNLMPIIDGINRPMNERACSHILTAQNVHVVPSGNTSSSWSLSNSNLSGGSSCAAHNCVSPDNSSTDSSSPNFHVSPSIPTNSPFGSSSLYPVISFNNTGPLPFLSKPNHSLKRAQSLPSIHLFDFPPLSKPNPLITFSPS